MFDEIKPFPPFHNQIINNSTPEPFQQTNQLVGDISGREIIIGFGNQRKNDCNFNHVASVINFNSDLEFEFVL